LHPMSVLPYGRGMVVCFICGGGSEGLKFGYAISPNPASFMYVKRTHLIIFKGARGFGSSYKTQSGMIHIGKNIECELRRQERTVAWFARKLYCNRQNVYDIFKRESIDTTLLRRISTILGHDFFKDLSDSMNE